LRRTRLRLARRETAAAVQKFFSVMACILVIACVVFAAGIVGSDTDRDHAYRQLAGTVTCALETEDLNPFLVIPYLLIILYAFLALAIICDKFFEPSLEQISERLGLSEDVAGATFMAAGSSAPELFTSISDAFVSQNSIGVGTIVGSAMFNILIIVAMSAAVTKEAVKIDWRPVARDVTFYLIAIGMLVLVLTNDGSTCIDLATKTIVLDSNATETTLCDHNFGIPRSWEGASMVFIYGVYILFMFFNKTILGRCSSEEIKVYDAAHGVEKSNQIPKESDEQRQESNGDKEDDDDDEPWWSIPKTKLGKGYFFLSVPLVAALNLTIPNCAVKGGRFENWFVSTFVMSIVWIGASCLLAVKLATEIGCMLGIDPVIMGVVLLAGGTSVPDMLASMIVARQGHADMAIANAVGSNVFDILLGLGLPWAFVEPVLDHVVLVNNESITSEVAILCGTVVLYLGTLVLNRWKIEKRIGVVFVVLYVVYIVYSLLMEKLQNN